MGKRYVLAALPASLLVASPTSFLAVGHFIGTTDAGPQAEALLGWGLGAAAALIVVSCWVAAKAGWGVAGSIGLSMTGSILVWLSLWTGAVVGGIYDYTIAPLPPNLVPAIGPIYLLSGVGLAIIVWRVAASERVSPRGKRVFLACGTAALLALLAACAALLGPRFMDFWKRRERAGALERELGRLGLVTEWHPRYGLQIKGTLGGTGVDPALLPRLVPILGDAPEVKLSLARTAAGDDDLPPLAAVPGLVKLDLRDTRVTDAGLACLSRFPGLQSISLGGCRVTDAGLAHLADVPALTEVYLANSSDNPTEVRVTDAGVSRLSKLAGLRRLQVPKGVSEKAMRELRAELPHLAAYHGY